MFTLREYQKKAVDKGVDFFLNGDHEDHPIIVAPTGSGKSIYIGHMANALKEGVLVIQPSKELLEQNYAKYIAYGGEAKIYSASMKRKEVGHVTFATIGSITKKPELFAHVKYIIIDECHLVPPFSGSMFMNFLGQMTDVKVLGLTATAFRLKTYLDPWTNRQFSMLNLLTRERPRFFNRFLHITQIKEIYDQGFLSQVRYHEVPWDNERLIANSTGAEYDEEVVDREIKLQMVYERIPGIIEASKKKGRKFRIVYVKNVVDAELLATQVPDSAAVSAKTHPKDRAQIIEKFRRGIITTVFNVGVLTIGFDFPELDTIIIARPTMSMALYMQMIGRGIRPHQSKKDCFVVDMCGNYSRFGEITDVEYRLNPKGKWAVMSKERQITGVPLEP